MDRNLRRIKEMSVESRKLDDIIERLDAMLKYMGNIQNSLAVIAKESSRSHAGQS